MLTLRNAKFGVLTVFALSGLLPSLAHSGTFDGRPKILLHGILPTVKNPCTYGSQILTDCQGVVTTGVVTDPVTWYYVYLVAARGNIPDMDGFLCGITYQGGAAGGATDGVGIDIYGWMRCAGIDMQSPSPAWPAPGSGNLVIFNSGPDSCRATDAAVGGYFYLGGYSPDVLQLTKRPVDDRALVAQCTPFIEHDLESTDLGSFVVSQGAIVPGCNPCAGPCSAVIPVRPVTWSSLKSLYP